MILLDTNILLRLTSKTHPHCAIARVAVHGLLARKERLVIVPQNLYEFWVVATRKPGVSAGENGMGMPTENASLWLSYFQRRFMLLAEHGNTLARWHDLVRALKIKGFPAHDARFVAAMQCHGINRIITFNAKDFSQHGIALIDPVTVPAA